MTTAMVVHLQQSTDGAGSTPNSDATDSVQVDLLAKVGALIVSDVDWVEGETDEGTPYFQIGDPNGLVDYLIEPHESVWRGVARGSARLFKDVIGPTAGTVAILAANGLAIYLSIAGEAAAGLLMGG